MVKTKQTARGSSAPRPEGMATAKFAGRGRGDLKRSSQMTHSTSRTRICQTCWKMMTSRREVNQAQVRLPSVQIHIRTVEEIEQLEGKTYRELTMSQHLPNTKKIYSNATDQTRMMAAFMYFVLYEQITSLKASQTGCSRDFQCQGTPFKRLVTGKKQPGGPGRSGEQRSKRTLEEVAELEGDTLAKQTRKSTRTPKSRTGKGKKSK